MLGIVLRKDNRYMIRKTINGIRQTLYANNKTTAQKLYNKLKRQNYININKTNNNNYTIEKWFNEWIKVYKEQFVSNETLKQIKQSVNRIILKFGKLQLNKLQTNEIQLFLNKMERTRTKERLIIYFNAGLQKAKDLNLIQYNPFNAVVKQPKIKTKQFAYVFKEQQIILNMIKNTEIEKDILCYLLCGARPNEIPTKENFDFENNIIHIYGTKNINSQHRVVEMSKEYAIIIQEYFKASNLHKFSYISKKFSEMCLKNRIENANIYRLRHTFASNHYILGTQAKQVQNWLGHSDIKITLNIYTDIDKTATKDKIKALYNNLYYEQ